MNYRRLQAAGIAIIASCAPSKLGSSSLEEPSAITQDLVAVSSDTATTVQETIKAKPAEESIEEKQVREDVFTKNSDDLLKALSELDIPFNDLGEQTAPDGSGLRYTVLHASTRWHGFTLTLPDLENIDSNYKFNLALNISDNQTGGQSTIYLKSNYSRDLARQIRDELHDEFQEDNKLSE